LDKRSVPFAFPLALVNFKIAISSCLEGYNFGGCLGSLRPLFVGHVQRIYVILQLLSCQTGALARFA
jgi:hypothetical protein